MIFKNYIELDDGGMALEYEAGWKLSLSDILDFFEEIFIGDFKDMEYKYLTYYPNNSDETIEFITNKRFHEIEEIKNADGKLELWGISDMFTEDFKILTETESKTVLIVFSSVNPNIIKMSKQARYLFDWFMSRMENFATARFAVREFIEFFHELLQDIDNLEVRERLLRLYKNFDVDFSKLEGEHLFDKLLKNEDEN